MVTKVTYNEKDNVIRCEGRVANTLLVIKFANFSNKNDYFSL